MPGTIFARDPEFPALPATAPRRPGRAVVAIGDHARVESVPATRNLSPPSRLGALLTGPEAVGAMVLGAALTALWVWWALAFGAFFPTVLYPGVIGLCLVLAVLIPFTPLPIQTRGPHVVAIGCLLALAALTLLSALWSPVPDAAIFDAIRTAFYAVAFATGLWFALLLGRNSPWSLAPMVIAGAVLVLLTLARAVLANSPDALLSGDGTLDYPLGYRNAEAALSFILFFTAVASASHPGFGPRWRIFSGAVASGCLSLAVLSQSRGSLIALCVALVVYGLSSKDRPRALTTLAAAALPIALLTPFLVGAFDAAGDRDVMLDGLHEGGIAAFWGTAVGALLVSGVVLLERRGVFNRSRDPVPGRVIAAVGTLLVAATIALLAVLGTGNWIDARIDEFREGGTPSLDTTSSRFTLDASSDRYDYWRVATDDAMDNPLLGTGSGGFKVTYLEHRNGTETPRDAHSVVFEVLGELGIPGLLLLLATLGAAGAAAVRSRRYGPNGALLSCVGLTIGAYWLVHASTDWLWSYPVPTALVFALLGGAGAIASRGVRDRRMRNRRRGAVIGLVLASVLIVPFFVAERLTLIGAGEQAAGDFDAAAGDLRTAADINPTADVPLVLIAEGELESGDRQAALAALDEAMSRQPDNFYTHLLAARILATDDPVRARAALAEARRLNPGDPGVAKLTDRLDGDPSRSP